VDSVQQAKPTKPDYLDSRFGEAMAEILALTAFMLAASLILLLLADSDDDNGGGGLREPVLIPIPVRDQRR
jgi:hypothetical protein